MRNRLPSFGAAAVAFALLAGACTGGAPGAETPTPPSPPPKVPVKLAFLEDLSVEDSIARVAPAFQAARLAFDEAMLAGDLPVEVELVAEDTGGDPETEASLAEGIASDPAFVGVIVAPFLDESADSGATLDAAGVATVSLSTLDEALSQQGWGTWFRAVATESEQGDALGAYIAGLPEAGRGVCVAGDGGVASDALVRAVRRSLGRGVAMEETATPAQVASPTFAAGVGRAGCGVLFWGGFSTEAASIRLQLSAAGLRKVRLVGADGTKDDAYLSTTGRAGEGTSVSCPCVDLSTSTALDAQRFIQDYQSEYGTPPGPYAAEGWDVAGMFVAAFRSGATTREAVAASLGALGAYEGLANTYAFEEDGELAQGPAAIRLYRDEGGRWIPLG